MPASDIIFIAPCSVVFVATFKCPRRDHLHCQSSLSLLPLLVRYKCGWQNTLEWCASSRVKADLDDFLGTWYESVAPRNALLGGSLSIYSPILFVRMINFDREC